MIGIALRNWLRLLSAVGCFLGTIAITIGLFMHYGCDAEYAVLTAKFIFGGSIGLALSLCLMNLIKWI